MCDQCIKICNAIAELTNDEGSTVTILCENPEFSGPSRMVECCGDWTNYTDERFRGESLIECLELAVKTKNESK
jgi:hypothetical protein